MARGTFMDHPSAARYLLAARASGPGEPLPPDLRPATAYDAYEIQRLTLAEIGPIGGWKVGAPGPDAPPSCAPMPQSGLHAGPAQLPNDEFSSREIESEIAFVLRHDLPPRDTPYTRADIIGAIATCHPGIEVLQSRFADPAAADPLSNLADLIRHGAYVLGPAIPHWQTFDFTHAEICQTIAGAELRRTGNPAGDMIRLLEWLANVGAVWAGGLRAGQILTTGSWTGAVPAPAFADVTAHFTGIGRVSLRFT
jgi:2-keto-4-pentenoate hydratase